MLVKKMEGLLSMVPGYVKLYRQLIDWEWYKDVNTKTLFLHCLIKANYEEKKWKGITIPEGSFITSSLHLAEELHLTRAQIRRAIYNLQTTNEIATKTTNKATIITVLNWAKYQELETTKTTNKKTIKSNETQPSNNQQTTTTKEVKKERINKEDLKEGGNTSRPSLEDIRIFCIQNGYTMDPEKFFNYQESKSWKVGTAPMKDWEAAVRNWEKREKEFIQERALKPNGNGSKKPEVKIDWLNQYVETQ